ncbi:fungal-specific transcription factor domain-containing protein [Kalaharituber pfeilii]|nr:fungal-specific transcription factor domain-containing protein [Kalaharituber pfeilii]
MDRHLLQFSNEGQGYHEQPQQNMDSLLQSALLSYQHHDITSSPHGMMVPSAHDRASSHASISTSTHPHHSLYNAHISQNPQEHPVQVFTQQPLRQLSTSMLQHPPQTSPQTSHHSYPHHPVLPSQSQPQAIQSVQGQPQAPMRPMQSHSPVGLDVSSQTSQSQNSSPEQSPSGSRSERIGRLGSHGGAGRRIILASGSSGAGTLSMPNGVTATGSAGQNQATKDASGKFPCVHCHKTYLHLKHLKRHLLRHTGDRPYQCVLCKDTFSRSDILKRHFQKCSIRRGNPGNLTHLAHAHDHQRKKPKGGREQGAGSSPTGANDSFSASNAILDNAILTSNCISNLGLSQNGSCSQCISLKAGCDGNTPCGRCNQLGTECIYCGDEMRGHKGEWFISSLGLQHAADCSLGLGTREIFNFPPPTHPHAHIQHHPQNMQAYQSATPIRSSPPYTPVTEHAYTSIEDAQGLTALSFGDTYNYHHDQVRLQQKMNPAQDDVKLKAQSEANNLVMSSSDQSLVYFPTTNAPSQASSSHAQGLEWGFPSGDGFYTSMPPNLTIQTQSNNGSIYNYDHTPLTATPISLNENGIVNWNVSMPLDPFQSKCERLKQLLFLEPENRLSTPESPSSHNSDPLSPSDDADLRQWITPHHIRHFIDSFRTNFQTHFPVLHMPTFQFQSVYDGLALAVICNGAVYSDRGITVEQVRRLMERCISVIDRGEPKCFHAEQNSRALSSDELQARALFAALSTWHGSERQRDRIRKCFGKLVLMARNSCFFRPLTIRETGPHGWSYYHQTDKSLKLPREWNWLAWIEQETRNRVMFGIYLLDAAFAIYFNEKPRIGLFDLKLTLPADDACWDATTSEECANLLGLNGPEHSAENITGTRMAKQLEISSQLEELLTIGKEFRSGSTNAYGKFILIHAIHVYIWRKQREFGLGQWGHLSQQMNDPNHRLTPTQQKNTEIQLFNQTVAHALDKWKRAWDADLLVQYPDMRRAGFCRDGIAFYWLAVLFTRQKKRDLVLKDIRDMKIILQVQQMLETVNRRPRSPFPPQEPGAVSGIDKTYGMDDHAFDMKLLLVPIEKELDVSGSGEGWQGKR